MKAPGVRGADPSADQKENVRDAMSGKMEGEGGSRIQGVIRNAAHKKILMESVESAQDNDSRTVRLMETDVTQSKQTSAETKGSFSVRSGRRTK